MFLLIVKQSTMKKLFTVLAIALFSFSTTFVDAQTTQTQTSKTSTKAAVHTKKDGTLDKRYKENKASSSTTVTGPTKKDGTPDMRYKANKSTSKTTTTKKKVATKM
jgi:hypothetical protein